MVIQIERKKRSKYSIDIEHLSLKSLDGKEEYCINLLDDFVLKSMALLYLKSSFYQKDPPDFWLSLLDGSSPIKPHIYKKTREKKEKNDAKRINNNTKIRYSYAEVLYQKSILTNNIFFTKEDAITAAFKLPFKDLKKIRNNEDVLKQYSLLYPK